MGRSLDKAAFRRRMLESGGIEAVEGAVQRGSHRPAQLYRLTDDPLSIEFAYALKPRKAS